MARRSPKVVHPDRDVLKTFLAAAARPAGTLQYHQLQGFLFAVASSPEIILPSEWMPVVFAGHEAGYRTISEARSIVGDLIYNSSGPQPTLVAEGLESQPERVYDTDVWAAVRHQAAPRKPI